MNKLGTLFAHTTVCYIPTPLSPPLANHIKLAEITVSMLGHIQILC